MNSPFLSIIIPTYNSESTLYNCLESIISQEFKNFEVLIIDGLSSDGTSDIPHLFNDSRIKFYSGKDQGVYDAMNKGIQIAAGDWCYFLGSDDSLFDRNVLNKFYNLVKTRENQIFYGNVIIEGDTSWAKEGAIYDGKFSKEKIISKNICHQSIFYNKQVFTKTGNYNQEYAICADHDFNIRALVNFKFEFFDFIVAKFSGNGLSSYPDYNFKNDYAKIIVKYHLTMLHRVNCSNQLIWNEVKFNFKRYKIHLSAYLFTIILFKKLKKSLTKSRIK